MSCFCFSVKAPAASLTLTSGMRAPLRAGGPRGRGAGGLPMPAPSAWEMRVRVCEIPSRHPGLPIGSPEVSWGRGLLCDSGSRWERGRDAMGPQVAARGPGQLLAGVRAGRSRARSSQVSPISALRPSGLGGSGSRTDARSASAHSRRRGLCVLAEEFDLDAQHVVEALAGRAIIAVASPSTRGDCATAPASRASEAASSTMYMPANDVPQAKIRRINAGLRGRPADDRAVILALAQKGQLLTGCPSEPPTASSRRRPRRSPHGRTAPRTGRARRP
jgi:hypothetical protein